MDELRAEDTRDAALATLVPRAWDPRFEDAGPIPGPRAGPIAIEGFRRGSRSRLMPSDARRFPGDDDFSKLARAACAAHALPRKELYETWEAALIITRAFEDDPGGGVELPSRVMDVAGGHGLLALALLALNPSLTSALVVDKRKPDSFERLYACVAVWPHVHGRVRFVEASVEKADCDGDVCWRRARVRRVDRFGARARGGSGAPWRWCRATAAWAARRPSRRGSGGTFRG